MQMSRFVDV